VPLTEAEGSTTRIIAIVPDPLRRLIPVARDAKLLRYSGEVVKGQLPLPGLIQDIEQLPLERTVVPLRPFP
jgi:hypothetical protein